ncbi:hypothetical protein [Chromobacterium violaceum]|nr:hypothetical protein [Chromobacterium violaceum]
MAALTACSPGVARNVQTAIDTLHHNGGPWQEAPHPAAANLAPTSAPRH